MTVFDRGYIKRVNNQTITYESVRGAKTVPVTLRATDQALDQALLLRQKLHSHGLLFKISNGVIEEVTVANPANKHKKEP